MTEIGIEREPRASQHEGKNGPRLVGQVKVSGRYNSISFVGDCFDLVSMFFFCFYFADGLRYCGVR